MKIIVSPIKCQGKKTKLIPHIKRKIENIQYEKWVEPFMGSGIVGFNVMPKEAIFGDNNGHIIRFFNDLQSKIITPENMKHFLEKEGNELKKIGKSHYYNIRERFNTTPNSFDLLFLSRACFNGVMRFNSKGEFNVPFCKKTNRFSKAYITKITNQIRKIQTIIEENNYKFLHQDFEKTINLAGKNDIIYCDPPYITRSSTYFDSWDEKKEEKLHDILSTANSKFILSTWYKNSFRENTFIEKLWKNFNIQKIEHFYFVGASEKNRSSIIEAIITNF